MIYLYTIFMLDPGHKGFIVHKDPCRTPCPLGSGLYGWHDFLLLPLFQCHTGFYGLGAENKLEVGIWQFSAIIARDFTFLLNSTMWLLLFRKIIRRLRLPVKV